MQELEKILEEINYRINEYVDHDYVRGSGDVVKGLSIAKSIIRKHLSRENTTEITRCSRDTQGAEHEINLPKEEFEMLRFSDSVTFRCGNEYVSLYMGEDEATREYKIVDDGWISVEERLPAGYERIGYNERGDKYMRRLEIAYMTDTIEYVHGYYDGYKWMDKHLNTIENAVAWKIHEPYRPEGSAKE